jgi:hypothetical protein
VKRAESESRDYPVKEDMPWQRREVRIQRAGQYILFAVVIAGACGLFSKGFISNGEAQSPDGTVQVRYERFGRVQSNMNMRIQVPAQTGDRFTVTIGNGALDTLEIQTLQPQPVEAVARANDLQLTFLTHNAHSGHTVWIGMQPQNMGAISMSVSVPNFQPARFSLWIYP